MLSGIWLVGCLGARSLIGRQPAKAAEQRTIEVRIIDRKVVAPEPVIRVTQGDRVELRWRSDEAVLLHLHGYDIELAVEPGVSTSMIFEAFATGRFPITSHGFGGEDHDHEALVHLEIHPR